jgi:hypothetical protein
VVTVGNARANWRALIDGYEQFRSFDRQELALIEPLRTLRLIHYSAWLARRWDDPIFAINFPWFGSSDYWQGQVQMLHEQIEAMQAAATAGLSWASAGGCHGAASDLRRCRWVLYLVALANRAAVQPARC